MYLRVIRDYLKGLNCSESFLKLVTNLSVNSTEVQDLFHVSMFTDGR